MKGAYGTIISTGQVDNSKSSKTQINGYYNVGQESKKIGMEIKNTTSRTTNIGIGDDSRVEILIGSPFGKNSNLSVGYFGSTDLYAGISYEYTFNSGKNNKTTCYGYFGIHPLFAATVVATSFVGKIDVSIIPTMTQFYTSFATQ